MTGNELKHSGGGLSRRRFLQGLAASTMAAAGLAGCAAPQADSKDESLSETGEGSASGYQYDWETAEGEIVHGVCPMLTIPGRPAVLASRAKPTLITITPRIAFSTL